MNNRDESQLYALEERFYSETVDLIRDAVVSQERKRQWVDKGMALLVRAQYATSSREYAAIVAQFDALEEAIRTAVA